LTNSQFFSHDMYIMKKIFLLLFPCTLFGFVLQPWYSPIGEFQLRSAYSYRYYPSVSQGKNPSSYHSHDHRLDLNFGVQFWPNWDLQFESDFLHSRKLNWGTERVGLQVRHLFLDDVVGDPISLSVGFQGFYVPTRSLRDVSVPYHAQGNLELGVAIGKEIDKTYNWLFRFWGCCTNGRLEWHPPEHTTYSDRAGPPPTPTAPAAGPLHCPGPSDPMVSPLRRHSVFRPVRLRYWADPSTSPRWILSQCCPITDSIRTGHYLCPYHLIKRKCWCEITNRDTVWCAECASGMEEHICRNGDDTCD